MSLQGLDPRVLDALQRASSLELFQLSAVIERLLADPKRIVQIRRDLHLGQPVRFLDWSSGHMREGTITAMKDTQVTIHEQVVHRAWTLPYAAIEPPPPGAPKPAAAPEPPPAPPRPGRNDFRPGEKVAFEDKYLNTIVGIIVRINQRTATIDPGDGTSWRVAFPLLRHVFDV